MRSLRSYVLFPQILFATLSLAFLASMMAVMSNRLGQFGKTLFRNSEMATVAIEVIQVRVQAKEALSNYLRTRDEKEYNAWLALFQARQKQITLLKELGLRSDGKLWHFVVTGMVITGDLQLQIVSALQGGDTQKLDRLLRLHSLSSEFATASLLDIRRYFESEIKLAKQNLKRSYHAVIAIAALFLGSILGFSLILFKFYRDYVISPLQRIHAGIHKVSEGSFELELPERNAPLELTEIATGLNTMTKSIRSYASDLLSAREEAERLANVKSVFLSNMSHEIRTPLNAIVGLSDLLEDGPLPEKARKNVQAISKSAKILLGIVNDILDLSRLESGNVFVKTTDFDVDELSRGLVEVIEPLAKQKGIRIDLDLEEGRSPVVQGDPVLLQKVLLNLLGNAVKYTERGSITLRVRRHEEDRCVFTVSDTGIGIPADMLPHIFERYLRAKNPDAKARVGTGLGLAIVKHLTERMGGAVGVESRLGRGSTFTIDLPLPSVDPESIAPLAHASVLRPEDFSPGRILVVDDSEDNLMLIGAFLEGYPFEIVEASSGEEALMRFRNESFDLVLMDIQMPGMDGYRTTARIRTMESPGQRVPILACTAYCMPEEVDKAHLSGCTAVLGKPIERSALLRALKEHWPSDSA